MVRTALKTTGQKLSEAEQQLRELERTLGELVARADRTPLPTLFVEGETDKLIIEGAWQAFYPDLPLPVDVQGGGGTKQMRGLAVPVEPLQKLLGDRLLLVLVDNDGPGRDLAPHDKLHAGGKWLRQKNGTWWCLLSPTEEFRNVMGELQISPGFWPFTIENAFTDDVRRQAMAEGVYAVTADPQADLLREANMAKKTLQLLRNLGNDDLAWLYVMAPTAQAKDDFAAWITAPERRTPDVYAAFEPVMRGLKELMDKHAKGELVPPQRPAAE